MFDPHHNAVDNYYLVNGSLKGSWEGLSRDVIIANWNGGKAKREPRRSSRTAATARSSRAITTATTSRTSSSGTPAARTFQGVIGFMYTTWQSKYGLLEQYGQAMRGSAKP